MFLQNGLNRIAVTQKLRNFIMNERDKRGLSATKVASLMERPQSWLAQIENGRTQTIKQKDLVLIFSAILSVDIDKADEYLSDNVDAFSENPSNSSDNVINRQKIRDVKRYSDFSSNATDKEFRDRKNFVVKVFNDFHNELPENALRTLQTFSRNIKFDFSFTMGLISIPFHVLSDADESVCRELYQKISDLFLEYANKDKHRVSRVVDEDAQSN